MHGLRQQQSSDRTGEPLDEIRPPEQSRYSFSIASRGGAAGSSPISNNPASSFSIPSRGAGRSPRQRIASGSPFSTRSPTVFSTRKPEAKSIVSSRVRRPQPMSIERNPIRSVWIERTKPARAAAAGIRFVGCGRRETSSTAQTHVFAETIYKFAEQFNNQLTAGKHAVLMQSVRGR